MNGKYEFLIKPFSTIVHDENDRKKTVCLAVGLDNQNKDQTTICLLVLGNISDLVLDRLEKDLLAGVAIGHFQILCAIQQEKAKKDPQGFFIKSFAYQEYDYAYPEIIQSGAAIGVTLFQEKYLREVVRKAVNMENIDWGEKAKKHLLRIKEEEYSGEPIIAYWEKEPLSMNWIVPLEVTKLWQNVQVFNNEQAEELAIKFHEAKNKSKLEGEILEHINK